MAQVDSENSTIVPYKTTWRSYLFEALAIAFILISAGIASCLIVSNLEGKIAHHCAVDLQRALQ